MKRLAPYLTYCPKSNARHPKLQSYLRPHFISMIGVVLLASCSQANVADSSSQNNGKNRGTGGLSKDHTEDTTKDQDIDKDPSKEISKEGKNTVDLSTCRDELKSVDAEINKLSFSLAEGCKVDDDCVRTKERVGSFKCPVGFSEPADLEFGTYLIFASKKEMVGQVSSQIVPLMAKRQQLFRDCPYNDGGCMQKIDPSQFKVVPKCFVTSAKSFCGWKSVPLGE